VRRRVAGLVAAVVLGGAGRHAAAAQVAANRATAYLPATDVADVRALWVNPAGLAAREEAAVLLDLSVQPLGSAGRLVQVSTGFNARGIAFGYQRDNFTNGIHGHTYRLGLGGSSKGLAFGAAVALYRGATAGTGWDLGVRYEWRPQVTVGGAVRDIGKPTVRGVQLEPTFVPSVTLRPSGAWLAISAQTQATSRAVLGHAFEVRAELPGRRPFGLLARLDTSRALRRRALVFGLSLGSANTLGVVGSIPGGGSQQNILSAYGVSTLVPGRP
jgi:hypothetical protein